MPQFVFLTQDNKALIGATKELSDAIPKADMLNLEFATASLKMPVFNAPDKDTLDAMLPEQFKPHLQAVPVDAVGAFLKGEVYHVGLSSQEDYEPAPDALTTLRNALLDDPRNTQARVADLRHQAYNQLGITLDSKEAKRAIEKPNLPFNVKKPLWGKGLKDAPPARQAQKMADFFTQHGAHPAGRFRFMNRLNELTKDNRLQDNVALIGYLHHYVGDENKNANTDKLYHLIGQQGKKLVGAFAAPVITEAFEAESNVARKRNTAEQFLSELEAMSHDTPELDPIATINAVMYNIGDDKAEWLAHHCEMAQRAPAPSLDNASDRPSLR